MPEPVRLLLPVPESALFSSRKLMDWSRKKKSSLCALALFSHKIEIVTNNTFKRFIEGPLILRDPVDLIFSALIPLTALLGK